MSLPAGLAEFQRRFLGAVRETGRSEDSSHTGVEAELARTPLAVSTGLGIYRRGYRATVEESLEALYASVREAVGEPVFRWLVAGYTTDRPATHPNLSAFGEHFAAWVEGREELDEAQLLGDLCRLEWAWHRVQMEASAPVGAASPVTPGAPRLVRPSRLIASSHAILDRWLVTRDGGRPAPSSTELLRLLVWRNAAGELRADRVEPDSWPLLVGAQDPDPERLLEAVDAAVEARGEAVVTAELAVLVRRGWLLASGT